MLNRVLCQTGLNGMTGLAIRAKKVLITKCGFVKIVDVSFCNQTWSALFLSVITAMSKCFDRLLYL